MRIQNILISFAALFSLSVLGIVYAQPHVTSLPAIQISDHDMTQGSVGNGNRGPGALLTGGKTAHAVWIEETGISEGSDLFYRDLMADSTINVSDGTQSEGDVNGTYKIFTAAADGTAHLLWFEAVSDTANDLFYWHTSLGTRKLTNRAQSIGALWVSDMHMALDSNEDAHIVWRDFSESEGNNMLYYWHNQATQQLAAGTNINALELDTYQDAVHVVWQQGGMLYHWNSQTVMTDTLQTPVSGFSVESNWMGVDDNGTAHVIWQEDGGDACFYTWDSVNKSVTPVLPGVACGVMQVRADASGLLHAAWSLYSTPNYHTYYWNPTLTDPLELTGGTYNVSFQVADNGKAHIYYESVNALWYWNSDMAAFEDLTTLAGITPDSLMIVDTALDAQGNIHLIWFQNGLYYWHSGTAVVTDLSADFFGTSIPDYTDVMIGVNNVMHFVAVRWGDVKCWNNQTNQSQLVSDLQGSSEGIQIVVDLLGKAHIGWEQSLPGGDYGMFYWNAANGAVELNETAVDENLSYGVRLAVDDNNTLYLLWVEKAEDTNEGDDLFAAIIAQEGNQIFLPMVMR